MTTIHMDGGAHIRLLAQGANDPTASTVCIYNTYSSNIIGRYQPITKITFQVFYA